MTPLQSQKVCALLQEILPGNAFYARKFAGCDLAAFHHLPFTTKDELLADQAAHPPYGTGLTWPRHRYTRLHQTSGTSGRPLRWLDTPESWTAMLDCWKTIFRIVELRSDDRLFFPFSFGPFLGFWTAFEAASREGFFCLPAGGLSSAARLRLIFDHALTVVFCTPTYALRLAEVATEQGMDLTTSPVRALIVAGEPGGSIPATRARIETTWGARVFDHSGMTEIGPCAVECVANPGGLHLLAEDYLAEVIAPSSGEPALPDTVGELVLTTLSRSGSPLIRYRTGDLVRPDPDPCPCGLALPRFGGGILGRVDDMIHLRGNNVYPSALEGVLRGFADIAEYRLEVVSTHALSSLRLTIEPTPLAAPGLEERVERAIRETFLFRPDVCLVAPGTLPRFEMKAQRLIRGA